MLYLSGDIYKQKQLYQTHYDLRVIEIVDDSQWRVAIPVCGFSDDIYIYTKPLETFYESQGREGIPV